MKAFDNLDDIKDYEELKGIINVYMDQYYNGNESDISDYEYDQLMIKLKAFEKAHPEWVDKNSPTQKIGGVAKREAGVKVTHNVPMLSIEDVFTKEDVAAWVEKVKQMHPDACFSVETKIDGLSMTLRYAAKDNGGMELVLGETRGDGLVGEDVTANAMVIPDVLKNLDLDYDSLELRGEVYMSHEDFDRYNEQQENNGKKPAANPRNLAAGTLRQLDSRITKERGLRMFIFNVQSGPDELMSSHTKGLAMLADKGISVVYNELCKDADEVIAAIDRIGEMRGDLEYDIDGAVVKIDQIAYRQDFPAGSKYSSGHIAYKYPPEEKEVVMESIEEDVGRTGKLTFVGHVHDRQTGKPARLCGTSVSKVTLHNQDYINENKIGVGGVYLIKKSGDVIPKLCGLVSEPEEVFKASTVCPVCGHQLVKDEDSADIRCVNPSCHAQLIRTVSYFVSLNCMNIVGFGDKYVEVLIQEGYINDYSDIYRLREHRDELIEKGLIGKEKNTDKLLDAIDSSKNNTPDRLLTALGIRNVGKSTASEIMKHYSNIMELMDADIEQLVAIPDIGQTTAECIYEFFHDADNAAIINRLSDCGVNMTMPENEQASDKLAGMIVVVTGSFDDYGRKDVENMITSNGGKCSGSVSKKTSLLVAGEAAGSKLTKAQDLGVKIVSIDEFLDMLK